MTELRPTDSPEPDHVIVVYDERTGQVRHVHQEITLPGGQAAAAADVMQRAIELARGMGDVGSPAAKLAALPVANEDRRLLHGRRVSLKVDVATRRLVAARI